MSWKAASGGAGWEPCRPVWGEPPAPTTVLYPVLLSQTSIGSLGTQEGAGIQGQAEQGSHNSNRRVAGDMFAVPPKSGR